MGLHNLIFNAVILSFPKKMDENVSVKDVYKGLVEYLRNNTEELVKLSEFIVKLRPNHEK